MSNPLGAFVMVLHGHIPYVLGHSTDPHGSAMLYEAAAETYIPLLWCLEELEGRGIKANITLSLSPITVEQLADERFKVWFEDYLREKMQGAAEDEAQFRGGGEENHFSYLARELWHGRYRALLEAFVEGYNRDLVGAFRRMQEIGQIELMTCGATHGYFPLLHEDVSIQAQLMQAVSNYQRHFMRRPRGIWLPECAYRPHALWGPSPVLGYLQDGQPELPVERLGVEELVGNSGFAYFVVDTHMLGGGASLPVSVREGDTTGKPWARINHLRDATPYTGPKTPYRPYFVGDRFEEHSPVSILVRDPDTSRQVWSAWQGYPGDFAYLEFHKKHMPHQLRYWRVTDDQNELGTKQAYYPDRADLRVREHAGHFLWLVKNKLRSAAWEGGMPVVCAPFDAELFGHWWFEGPSWLTKLLDWMNSDPEISVMKASDYVTRHGPDRAITLPEGSWGAEGGHNVWLNAETAWTWHLVYDAEKDFKGLVAHHAENPDPVVKRLIQQAGRELLLLQASDWQFLISTWSAHDYASARLRHHYDDYKFLAELARSTAEGNVPDHEQEMRVDAICERDRPFPDLDPRWWLPDPPEAPPVTGGE